MSDKASIRIIEVLDRLVPGGGVQDWLMNITRRIDHSHLHLDFLATNAQEYDTELRELGCRVFVAPSYHHLFAYSLFLSNVLREYGPYDIIHVHSHYHSGHVLRIAWKAGIPVRLVHSHVNDQWQLPLFSFPRRVFYTYMLKWIRQFATDGFAVSSCAACHLFGDNWRSDPRWHVFPSAFKQDAFCNREVDSYAIRHELGIAQDTFVVGHVGQFVKLKNQVFLVRMMAALAKKNLNIRLLLIGDGPLFPAVRQEVDRLGLNEYVIMTGYRSDVPALMLGAMDAFVFPSLAEGLGLVLLEAQAAGLPILITPEIPPEVIVVKSLVQTLPLEIGENAWGEALMSLMGCAPPVSKLEAQNLLKESLFNIDNNARELKNLYNKLYNRDCASSEII